VKRPMVEKYRMLEQLKEHDQAIYDIRMKRLPIEDQIFDLSQKIRRKDGDVDSLRSQRREQVKLWAENALEERRARLEQLQRRLDDERKRLEADSKNKERFVETQLKRLDDDRGGLKGDFAFPMLPPRERARAREQGIETDTTQAAPTSQDQ
jgi:hypothetical protein